MTDDFEKLKKVEHLHNVLSDLTNAILILQRIPPDIYSDLDKSDACVRRALYSLTNEECIEAFERKIKTTKQEIIKLLS